MAKISYQGNVTGKAHTQITYNMYDKTSQVGDKNR